MYYKREKLSFKYTIYNNQVNEVKWIKKCVPRRKSDVPSIVYQLVS